MKYIGVSTWNIPHAMLSSFPYKGEHLVRYSRIFNAVEINTSFYKDHLAKSYVKWAALTPAHFRFSVKLNQKFTHTCEDASTIELSDSLESIACLEEKWRALLVQFPAGKNFSSLNMNKFYKIIRKRFDGIVAIEPRNLTWNCQESLELMNEYNITKVIADPEQCPGILTKGVKYIRMHGRPEIYRSNYDDDSLVRLNKEFDSNEDEEDWCIFNNTTYGYATANALKLASLIESFGRIPLFDEGASPTYQ